MRISQTALCVSLSLLAAAAVAAPDPGAVKDLGTKLKAVAAHQPGEDAKALGEAAALVTDIANSAGGGAAVEPLLLEALGQARSRRAKIFLCRQVTFVGGPASVPVLSGLLADAELSHGARRALERIGTPAADAAILGALPKTSGEARIGIVSSLGTRRVQGAVPALAKLLADEGKETVRMAAIALGRIGTAQAVEALRKAKSSGAAADSVRLDVSLVEAAGHLAKAGQTDAATAICTDAFRTGTASHVRLGGLRGLAAVQGERVAPLLVKALRDGDRQIRFGAAALIGEVPGAAITRAVADVLPALEEDMTLRLIGALGRRGDDQVVRVLKPLLSNTSEPIRCAVLRALGDAGGQAELGLLLDRCLVDSEAEAAAARDALTALDGDGVGQALAARVGTGTPESRREAVAALARRRDGSATSVILKAAQSDDKELRLAALDALTSLGGADVVPALLDMLTAPERASDAAAVGKALNTALGGIADPAARAEPITAAYRKAGVDAKPVLLGLLKQAPTPGALAAVRGGVAAREEPVRKAAFRVLCDWPAAAAAPDLIALAEKTDDMVEHVLALRGYIRLAGEAKRPVPMYGKALQAARRVEEKRLALSALTGRSGEAALDLAESLLQTDGLKQEAALAALGIGERLLAENADRAKAAGRKVLAVARGDDMKLRAENLAAGKSVVATGRVLDGKGFVTWWLGSGPFRKEGAKGIGSHDVPFAPESATPADAEWQELTEGIDGGKINLIQALGRGGACAGYVHTRIWSPKEQQAQLQLGYDDSGLVWLNSEVVHNDKRTGPAKAGAVKLNVTLNEGWNEIMMKVTDSAGRWELYCAVKNPNGRSLRGLKMAPAPMLDGKPRITPVSMKKAEGVTTVATGAKPRAKGRAAKSNKTPDAAPAAKIAAAVPLKARVTPSKLHKIMVLSYRSHDPARAAGEHALKLMSERTKAFEVTVVRDGAQLPKVIMPDYLAQFDAVLVNNSTGGAGKAENGKELTENLDAYVRAGGGLIGIHAATDNRFGKIFGGFFTGHPWHMDVGVKLDDPQHPLAAAFKGKGFRVTDEIYQFAKGAYTREELHVLLSLDIERTDMNRKGIKRTDNDFAVAWVKAHGKGRVFYGSLGHRVDIFQRPDIMQFYLDGIQFVLGDLSADTTPSAALNPAPAPAPAPPAAKAK